MTLCLLLNGDFDDNFHFGVCATASNAVMSYVVRGDVGHCAVMSDIVRGNVVRHTG